MVYYRQLFSIFYMDHDQRVYQSKDCVITMYNIFVSYQTEIVNLFNLPFIDLFYPTHDTFTLMRLSR